MPWFVKKPVRIEAHQWDGVSIGEIMPFFATGAALPQAPDDGHVRPGIGFTPPDGQLHIPTLEGTMTAQPGDWIIRGVKGEFYPCKPDIFAESYNPVP